MVQCETCGSEFIQNVGRGRKARYCSTACRMRAHRARQAGVPRAMRDRDCWVRADGKRPIMPNGRAASSTDRRTWGSWSEVQTGAGDGFGIMLGDGLGCYDLDHVSDMEARSFMASILEPIIFVERSMSGRGVHVFVEADEAPGWRRVIDGVSVERYTWGRFIRVTGEPIGL